MHAYCPKCGGHHSRTHKVVITDIAHKDAYNTAFAGTSYRAIGITRPGEYIIYECYSHQHAGETVYWAERVGDA